MRILVTGAGGQLGRELVRMAPAGAELVARDRQALDVGDRTAVLEGLRALRPAVVVNAAAYTAVDKAESDPEAASRGNADGPGFLAEGCREVGARLVHVSTDFVFDGATSRPYRPDDPPAPLGVYGATKLEGERRVLREIPNRSLIVRTAWVYSSHGRNFVLTMIRLMRERGTVRVVSDQVGTPTSARELAIALWDLIRLDATGVHHWTDAGVASWYDLAEAVRRLGQTRGLVPSNARVVPISTSEYPTPAHRPACSVLDKSSTWSILGRTSRHWLETLDEVLAECAHA